MGKEAKIGLGVILILLITFGVVLAKKLGGLGGPLDVAAADENGSGTGKLKSGPGGEPQSAPIPVAGPAERTIVPTADTVSGVPERPPGEDGGYLASSVGGTTAHPTGLSAGGTSASALLPSTPAPKVGELYGAHYPAEQTGRADQATQPTSPGTTTTGAYSGGWGSANSGYGTDPLRNRATQAPNAAAPVNQGSNILRVTPPPGQSAQQAARQDYPYAATDPYATNASGSPQVANGDWRNPPQTYATPTRPAAAVPQTAAAGNAAGVDTPYANPQYGDPHYATEAPRREDGRYEVQPNDSYWAICKRLYGAGAYFKALAEHNRRRIPQENRLIVGDLILAPSASELEKSYPSLCPKPSRREALRTRATAVSTRGSYATGRTYKVEEGDTLFDIARYELGKATRWVEIYQLNRDMLGKDFDYITPGTQLALPENSRPSESSSAITRNPSAASVY